MKKISDITVQKRIVIYFILIIVLPSIVMGGLAFRGVKNDQALIERENRRQALEVGNQIIESTRAILLNHEDECEKIGLNRPLTKEEFFIDTLLEDFLLLHPIVQSIFYVSEVEVKMLRSHLQYFPRDVIISSQKKNLAVEKELETGWRYEYRDKDSDKALSFYKQAIDKLIDNYSKAMALNAIARLQKKTGNFQEAVGSYKILSRDYGNYYINESMPLGLIANVELSKLLIELGDINGAIKVQISQQENLVNRKWEINEGTYSFFANETKEFLQDQEMNLAGHDDVLVSRLDSLQRKQQKLQLETRSLLSLHKNIVPGMIDSDIIARERRIEESGGLTYLMSIIPDSTIGHWCLLISIDRLLDQYIEPQLRLASVKGRWHWLLRDDQGENLVHSDVTAAGMDFVEMSFPAQLPVWTLLAYTKPNTMFQTFLQSGQGIYFYMFLFIGTVLVVGLLFIFYSVNRELYLTKMKSDFIATVSHEFKSPLTAIGQITEMLQQGRVPSGKRDKYYSVMLQQEARLTHLIDNILDFSRIERGKKSYTLEETDIASLIYDTVDRYQRRMRNKSLQINLSIQPGMPNIEVDSKTIEQVLHNLLDNAIKYSENAKAIDLHTEMDNSHIIISVRDYGIGIAKEDQTRIFERFYRAGNKKTHNIKGSGIGLALVKEIVEAHGGKTQVSSRLGEGSTFSVYLPLEINCTL